MILVAQGIGRAGEIRIPCCWRGVILENGYISLLLGCQTAGFIQFCQEAAIFRSLRAPAWCRLGRINCVDGDLCVMCDLTTTISSLRIISELICSQASVIWNTLWSMRFHFHGDSGGTFPFLWVLLSGQTQVEFVLCVGCTFSPFSFLFRFLILWYRDGTCIC